jgi:hypothetical protein
MAGDRREMFLSGDEASTRTLEEELYSGKIRDEAGLYGRARDLGVVLSIRDDKCKVQERDGVLVGEVSESDGGSRRTRRLYVSCGYYVIADSYGRGEKEVSRGTASCFVVLGNRVTQEVANRCIASYWKAASGGPADALRVIMITMQEAASLTPSVSRDYTLVQTSRVIEFPRIMDTEDASKPAP